MALQAGRMPSLPAVYGQALVRGARSRLGRRRQAAELPDTVLSAAGVKPADTALGDFQRMLGQPPSVDNLPSGFVHTVAFPLAMSIMARTDFPLPLLGMVHVGNEVDHLRAIPAGQPLEISAWAENLRPHRAGTQVDLLTSVASAGTPAWIGRSTYLARGVRLGEDPVQPASNEQPGFNPPHPTAVWNLSADTGRRYAEVSGDYNPIHLGILPARALGLKQPIAHGMYLASRMIAEVAGRGVEGMRWSIDFVSPVPLPGRISLAVSERRSGGSWRGADVIAWDPRRRRTCFTGSLEMLENGR